MMKKTVLLLFVLSGIFIKSYAQNTKFDGYWVGMIPSSDDSKTSIILKIENGKGQRLFYDKEAKVFKASSFEKEDTMIERNNLVYTWLNSGGVWSESQSHMISLIDKSTVKIVWIRQVNNIAESANTEWFVYGRGTLTHYSAAEFDDLLKEVNKANN